MEYSKNRFDCDLMYDHIQDDRYKVVDDIIYYKYHIYLDLGSTLREKIMWAMHDTPLARHMRKFITY